jgi:hypothetical protein
MEKFLNFDGNLVGTKDVFYVKLDGGEIILLYKENTELLIAQASSATAEDKARIDAALVELWSKGYTDSVMDVSLSSAVTAIVPQ